MREVKRYSLVFLASVLAIVGCKQDSKSLYPKSEDTVSASAPKPKEQIKIEPVLEATGELAKLSASLKNDAFYLYSLSSDQALPVHYRTEIVRKKGEKPEVKEGEGTIQSRLISIGENEAKFAIDRNGDLAGILGSGEELVLKADGIYTTTFSGTALKTPVLELPGTLTVGKTWNTNTTIDNPTVGKLTLTMKSQIVGQEKIKTAFGEFDALKVTADGTAKSKNVSSTTRVTQWMVRGIGMVKLTLEAKDSNGVQQTTNLEIAQPSK